MTFNGLPLHPLVVHLTVVLLPVLVLLSVASLHPRWRERLRLPVLGLAVVSAALVWFTVKTGEHLLAKDTFLGHTADAHQRYADRLKYVTYGFAALAVVRFALDGRPGLIRWIFALLVVGGAIAIGVLTYQTGDAGARLVYPAN